MERKLVLLIDFNNVLFSSYYGDKLYNSKGINVNAIKGFFFRIKMLQDTFSPTYIVLCNDLSRDKTFRRKLYKPYKANRKTHDEDIIQQIKYASQLASLLGYPFINNIEYEADDVLGMISRYTHEHDMDCVIVSSDRDLYQLIQEDVFIYSPRTKEIVDLIYLQDNYKLTPQQWIELKAIQGDRSDNIPGINGIGETTALKLMTKYGSIENIYNHLNELNPKTKELLIAGEKDLPLMKQLVTILTDYNLIDFKPEMLERNEIYVNEVFNLINELEIYSLEDVIRYSLLP